MKKNQFYIKNTDISIRYGDTMQTVDANNGTNHFYTVTPENADLLKQMGLLSDIPTSKTTKTNQNIDPKLNLCTRIAKNMGWSVEKTKGFIGKILEISPSAVYHIMSKEIALILDQNYSDHIKNTKLLYVISPLNFNIISSYVEHNNNEYKNIAFFRTRKDAEEAKKCLKPLEDICCGK